MSKSQLKPHLPILQPLTVNRARLREKLRAAEHQKLTLIAAPPGYGKTTLVTQFAHETALPVAWHWLEEYERDVPNLFHHCLTTLSSIVPGIRSAASDAGSSAEELATFVTDFLRGKLDSHFFYVLDDIHHLINAPQAETWLRTFITTMPSVCHLILIGRSLPAITVSELIARRQVIAIGQEELSFNFQEVAELAEKTGLALSPTQIQQIFTRLGGWPAGLLLAFQPLPTDLEATLLNNGSGPEGLFDALADVMFRSQPPLLQSFLLSSSTLSRMTPSLCQAALGLSDSLPYLTEALRRNLFIAQVPGGMVYHSLFRDFLQHRLRQQDPTLFTQLHTNAGHWFEANNRLDEAFEHYASAERWEKAAGIAGQTAHIYYSSGHTETLLRWQMQLIDQPVRVQSPRLFHFCAMIHRDRYEYQFAGASSSVAEEGFRAQDNEVGLIQTALTRATIEAQRGNYQQAIELAEPFVKRPSTPANLRGYALAILGTAHIYLRNLEAAIDCLEQALPFYRATGDAFAIASFLLTIEETYIRLGRFHDAEILLHEALSIRQALGEKAGLVMALNNSGYHYHLLGDYEQAMQTLQEAAQMASHASERSAEGHILWSLGDLQRDRGTFIEASLLYNKALDLIGDHEPFLRSNILVSLATLRRWENRLSESQTFALEALSAAQTYNLNWEKELAVVALGAIRIKQGDHEASRQYLDKIVDDWQKHPSPQLSHTLGICAQMALAASDTVAADYYLRLAIQSVSHPALLQPLIAEIAFTPLLEIYVLDHAERYQELGKGLSQLKSIQKQVPEHQNDKPLTDKITYSIRVRTLGQEHVERDGNAIPQSAWQAASARELFFYLLLKGPTSREDIGLTFWPDSSPQQIRQKFHNALHRIRDAVGTNVVLFDDELYAINRDLDTWCDVFELESVVQQAQLASPLLTYTETLWQRAAALYQGEFLPDFDADWIVHYRERLTQLHLQSLLALGNCVRERGSTQEAIRIYNRALQIDPYREDIHRALLNSYSLLGDATRIVRHFDTLTNLLDTELGIAPSLETRILVQTLLG